MTKQSNNHSLAESISALADNEASPLELHRLLKACESDPEVKSTWARYQLISAAMRRDLPEVQTGDFAARLSAALENEPSHKGEPVGQTCGGKGWAELRWPRQWRWLPLLGFKISPPSWVNRSLRR